MQRWIYNWTLWLMLAMVTGEPPSRTQWSERMVRKQHITTEQMRQSTIYWCNFAVRVRYGCYMLMIYIMECKLPMNSHPMLLYYFFCCCCCSCCGCRCCCFMAQTVLIRALKGAQIYGGNIINDHGARRAICNGRHLGGVVGYYRTHDVQCGNNFLALLPCTV